MLVKPIPFYYNILYSKPDGFLYWVSSRCFAIASTCVKLSKDWFVKRLCFVGVLLLREWVNVCKASFVG